MKKKELNELKAKSIAELTKKLTELQKEKVNTQLEFKMGKLKNVHLIKQKRKEIAKIKTILSLKTLAAQVAQAPKEVANAPS